MLRVVSSPRHRGCSGSLMRCDAGRTERLAVNVSCPSVTPLCHALRGEPRGAERERPTRGGTVASSSRDQLRQPGEFSDLHGPRVVERHENGLVCRDLGPGTSGSRRVLLAALGGAVLAESVGQALESRAARPESNPASDRLSSSTPTKSDSCAMVGVTKACDELRRFGKITTLSSVGAFGAEALRHIKSSSATVDNHTPTGYPQGLQRKSSTFKPDWDRLSVAIGFSACYTGLFQPHWFAFLNSLSWADILPVLPGAPGRVEEFMAPLLLNQLVVIPALYWPSFFLFNGAVRQQTLPEIAADLLERLPMAMKVNLTFWLPAQGFQFASVPPEDQATYVALMGVIWNALLTLVTSPPDAASEVATGPAAAAEAECVSSDPPAAGVGP